MAQSAEECQVSCRMLAHYRPPRKGSTLPLLPLSSPHSPCPPQLSCTYESECNFFTYFRQDHFQARHLLSALHTSLGLLQTSPKYIFSSLLTVQCESHSAMHIVHCLHASNAA